MICLLISISWRHFSFRYTYVSGRSHVRHTCISRIHIHPTNIARSSNFSHTFDVRRRHIISLIRCCMMWWDILFFHGSFSLMWCEKMALIITKFYNIVWITKGWFRCTNLLVEGEGCYYNLLERSFRYWRAYGIEKSKYTNRFEYI